ncbi:MAG: hypothetical protein ACREJC_05805, partial [Tepidisphaeraceae bacterium]
MSVTSLAVGSSLGITMLMRLGTKLKHGAAAFSGTGEYLLTNSRSELISAINGWRWHLSSGGVDPDRRYPHSVPTRHMRSIDTNAVSSGHSPKYS